MIDSSEEHEFNSSERDYSDSDFSVSEEEPQEEDGFKKSSDSSANRTQSGVQDFSTTNELTTTLCTNDSNKRDSDQKRAYTFQRRKPNPRGISKLRRKWSNKIEEASVNKLASTTCCKKLKCFRNVNKSFLIQKMKAVFMMEMRKRRESLAAMLGSQGHFFFDGKRVCAAFLTKAFCFSRDLQSSVRAISRKALLEFSSQTAESSPTVMFSINNSTQNPNSSSILSAPAKEAIIAYLVKVADETGDKMPDTNEKHLPFQSKQEVYNHFRDHFQRTTENGQCNLPSLNYFLRTWKKSCRQIKVRKSTRFSKCDICEHLNAEMKHRITTFQSTSDLLFQKRAHFSMVLDERLEYKRKKDIASLDPSNAWSVIIDGADQRAYGLPHFISKTKAQRGQALRVKLIGILEHAAENKLRLLTMTDEHKSGANHIIESIHRYLMDRSLSSAVPPTMYVQVDNCTRENKNRFFLSYMESLVRWKVFKVIEVSFLPIGHTHEDIDQAFSTTSNRLRQRDAITLPDMLCELRQVYNKHTSVAHMKQVINWSGLCEQERVLTTVKNFSHYRFFRFFRENEPRTESLSNISCWVKATVHDEWKDLGSLFLKSVPDLSKTPPTIFSDSEANMVKKAEITKRIESEEARIKEPLKLGHLKELRDAVYRPRKEKFHWNLQDCIELSKVRALDNTIKSNSNSQVRSHEHDNDEYSLDLVVDGTYEEQSQEDADIEDALPAKRNGNAERAKPNAQTTSNDSTGYTYEMNSYVAVLAETSDKMPSFWVGKVVKVKSDEEGVVRSMTVHWFEPYGKDGLQLDKFASKYAPSYLDKGTPKQRPWTNEVETSAVLINFQSFLATRRLPSAVQKHLRVSLPQNVSGS